MDIEAFLNESGVPISKKQVVLGEPIKSVGTFEVPVKLMEGVSATLKVDVQAEA